MEYNSEQETVSALVKLVISSKRLNKWYLA